MTAERRHRKNEEILLASISCGLASRKINWRQKQPDWRHGETNWRQKYRNWRYYHKKGGSGYSPTRFAFRAHEMRILRRSMERPLPKKKGAAHGKTERRKCNTEAF